MQGLERVQRLVHLPYVLPLKRSPFQVPNLQNISAHFFDNYQQLRLLTQRESRWSRVATVPHGTIQKNFCAHFHPRRGFTFSDTTSVRDCV